MPMFKIYVGNLSPRTTAEQLQVMFAKQTEVADIDLVKDKETGKPRGFAVVMTRDEVSGRMAILKLNGAFVDGKKIIVNEIGKGPPKRPAGKHKPRPAGAPASPSRGYGGYGSRPAAPPTASGPEPGNQAQPGNPGQGPAYGRPAHFSNRPGRHFSRNRPFRPRQG